MKFFHVSKTFKFLSNFSLIQGLIHVWGTSSHSINFSTYKRLFHVWEFVSRLRNFSTFEGFVFWILFVCVCRIKFTSLKHFSLLAALSTDTNWFMNNYSHLECNLQFTILYCRILDYLPTHHSLSFADILIFFNWKFCHVKRW